MDIFERITNLSSEPSQEEYDNLEATLLSKLDKDSLHILIAKCKPDNKVSYDSNKESLLVKSKEVTQKYVYQFKYWQSKIPFDRYLFKSLKNVIFNITSSNDNVFYIQRPVCPGCKFFNQKTFLLNSTGTSNFPNGLFYCSECDFKLKNQKNLDFNRKLVYNTFKMYSKAGGKCPCCLKWIPKSVFNNDFGICPFCDFSGKESELLRGNHPTSLLAEPNSNILDVKEYSSIENNSPETNLSNKQEFFNNFKLLTKVLEDQNSALTKRSRGTTLVQKHLMYKAFYDATFKYPEQMVDYLVYQKLTDGFNIQSKIFQEYALLIENYLPFTMVKNNESVIITDYCDPLLNLYLGISTFETEIDDKFAIKNKTNEVYIGGNKLVNYGPCFIGRLISVTEKSSGKDITKYVKEYSFNNIIMKNNIVPKTNVIVKHFRIASHYEMGPMVFLQRIRKDITTKIKKVLNGK